MQANSTVTLFRQTRRGETIFTPSYSTVHRDTSSHPSAAEARRWSGRFRRKCFHGNRCADSRRVCRQAQQWARL